MGRGYLVCAGDGGHEWLRWDEELGDFIFHVEWRFIPVPGKKGYNSGVYVRNSADASVWHQAQTGDASGGYLFGDTPVNGQVKRVNLSRQLRDKRIKPAGEWNTYEITCKGKEISLWVNGAIDLRLRRLRGPARLRRPRGRGLADRVPQGEGQAARRPLIEPGGSLENAL